MQNTVGGGVKYFTTEELRSEKPFKLLFCYTPCFFRFSNPSSEGSSAGKIGKLCNTGAPAQPYYISSSVAYFLFRYSLRNKNRSSIVYIVRHNLHKTVKN